MRALLFLLPLLVAADEKADALKQKLELFNSVRNGLQETGDTNLIQAKALFVTALISTGHSRFAQTLDDKARFADFMQRAASEIGITNLNPAEVESVYSMLTNVTRMFLLHPDLPLSLYDWPPPRLSNTNSMATVRSFIEKHGWKMHTNEQFILGMGVRSAPLTGLPWPEIEGHTYHAVTCDGILYVVMRGFGAETGGLAWNPRTNRFNGWITGFKPLGNGWYAWKQTGDPTAEKVYEGQESKKPSVEPKAVSR